MTKAHWVCLRCGERGEYEEPDTKTDTGAAAKHLAPKGDCPGATTTSMRAELLDAIATKVGRWA